MTTNRTAQVELYNVYPTVRTFVTVRALNRMSTIPSNGWLVRKPNALGGDDFVKFGADRAAAEKFCAEFNAKEST